MIHSGLITSLKALCNTYRNSLTKDTVYKSFSSKIKNFSIWKLASLLSIVVPKMYFPYPQSTKMDVGLKLQSERRIPMVEGLQARHGWWTLSSNFSIDGVPIMNFWSKSDYKTTLVAHSVETKKKGLPTFFGLALSTLLSGAHRYYDSYISVALGLRPDFSKSQPQINFNCL